MNPTFRTQPIKEGIGLQNNIKLKREKILERQQGETGMLGSKLKSGWERGECTKNDLCHRLYSGDFGKNKLPYLEPV